MDSITKFISQYLSPIIDFTTKNPALITPFLAIFSTWSTILLSKYLSFRDYESLLIKDQSSEIPNIEYHKRRQLTYPDLILNTWYHLCDSEELKIGEVKEVRALGRVFVLWRNSEGKVVCQDAFCIHLGANLGGMALITVIKNI